MAFDPFKISEGMNAHLQGAARIDPESYSLKVKRIYDMVNNQPMWINEIARATGINPKTVSRICYELEKKNFFVMREIRDDLLKYTGLIQYMPYHLWAQIEASDSEIEDAIEDIIVISKSSLISTQFIELALQEAGIIVFGAENVTASSYDDNAADLMVTNRQPMLQFEVSCRNANPVDLNYITTKHERYNDKTMLVIISPPLTAIAMDDVKLSPKIAYERFPINDDGFPIIPPNSGSPTVDQKYGELWSTTGISPMDIGPLFARHYRRANLISYADAVHQLTMILANGYNDGKIYQQPGPPPDYEKYARKPVDWQQRFELLYLELGPTRLARTFRVTPGTVYRWMREGRIPTWRMPTLKRKWYYEGR